MRKTSDELDPITAQLRHEGDRLRRLMTKLVLLPIVVGVLVVAGSYWVVDVARKQLAAAHSAKEELDMQIEELQVHKSELEDQIAARQALFQRYEKQLPQEAALLDEGLAAAKTGDYARAMTNYERVLKVNPRNELALQLQGAAQSRGGQQDAAIRSFERALAIDPDDAETWYQLGLALWKAGDKERAVQSLDRSFELEPKNVERAYRDPAYKPIRDYLETRTGGQSASTEQERVIIQRAIEAAKAGRYNDAIEGYQAALEINPANAVVLNYLGYTSFRTGQYEDAVRSLARAVELDTGRAELHYNLALALWKLGKRDQALAAVDEAFRLDPAFEQRSKADPQYRQLGKYRAARGNN